MNDPVVRRYDRYRVFKGATVVKNLGWLLRHREEAMHVTLFKRGDWSAFLEVTGRDGDDGSVWVYSCVFGSWYIAKHFVFTKLAYCACIESVHVEGITRDH